MTEPLPPILPAPEPYVPPRRSWVVRHRTPLIVTAAAVAAIGAGVGIAVAASGDSHAGHVASTSTTSPATTVPASGPRKHAAKGTRVTIVSESGSTWTVRTKAGQTLTVTITPQTQFGSKKRPATAAQFTPGKTAVIGGPISNNAVTATRVAAPGSHSDSNASGSHSPTPNPSPSPDTSSATS